MLHNPFQEDNISKGNKPLVIKYFGGRITVFKDVLGHFFCTALECSSNWNVDRDLHLLFLVLLTELSQKEEKSQDGAQMWIDISQNQGILE